MIEIDVSLWGDWDKLMDYIKEMNGKGFKMKLINADTLFQIWYGEELEKIGFTAKEVV